jgi:alcohol dehydrogenase (NADP+)
VEIHPFNAQASFTEFCKEHGIVVTGFSPLGAASYSWLDAGVQQTVLSDPTLAEIAAAHKKSVAQICIRWQVQRGLTVVPKSVNPERQSANLAVDDWALTDEDMEKILALDKRIRCVHPLRTWLCVMQPLLSFFNHPRSPMITYLILSEPSRERQRSLLEVAHERKRRR